ncbi:MAG: helix-turn-helix transcriptional regulator [Solirubrobacterales bacterium]
MSTPQGNRSARTAEHPLRYTRHIRGLSQQQLADLTGLDRTTLSRLENGHERPQPRTRAVLARALRCDPDSLFGPPRSTSRGR